MTIPIRLPDGRVIVPDVEHTCSNQASEMLRTSARTYVQVFIRSDPERQPPAYMIVNTYTPFSVPAPYCPFCGEHLHL